MGAMAGTKPNQIHSSHLKLLSNPGSDIPFHQTKYPIIIIQIIPIVEKIFIFEEC